MDNKQRYLLTCLIEEAGELIQAATKCLRHGFDSYHPDRPNVTNLQDLRREALDLLAVQDVLAIDLMSTGWIDKSEVVEPHEDGPISPSLPCFELGDYDDKQSHVLEQARRA